MVRLVGGPSIKEGRVEYCNSGIWHTLCGNGWEDEQEARVVCNTLGYDTNLGEGEWFACINIYDFEELKNMETTILKYFACCGCSSFVQLLPFMLQYPWCLVSAGIQALFFPRIFSVALVTVH